MVTIPTNEPSTIIAGDTWQWSRRDLSDYPASSWTLEYYLLKADNKLRLLLLLMGIILRLLSLHQQRQRTQQVSIDGMHMFQRTPSGIKLTKGRLR